MTDSILACQNLDMTFSKEGYLIKALKNVSFDLKYKEKLGVIGESGSGKSTIAKLVTGLYRPTDGDILFHGKSIVGLAGQEQKKIYRKIQMVFQDAHGSFNPRRKIGQSMADTIRHLSTDPRPVHEQVAALLEDVGLPSSYGDKYPHELSGGECQRAAIARAMSVHPEILICDEATSALDVSVQAKVVKLLMKLADIHSMSLIFITHDLPLVSRISDRILIMNRGELVEIGTTKEICTHPRSAYTKELLDAVC